MSSLYQCAFSLTHATSAQMNEVLKFRAYTKNFLAITTYKHVKIFDRRCVCVVVLWKFWRRYNNTACLIWIFVCTHHGTSLLSIYLLSEHIQIFVNVWHVRLFFITWTTFIHIPKFFATIVYTHVIKL